MTHTEYFEKCCNVTQGKGWQTQMIHMLATIADSLAAIADYLEEQDTDGGADDDK